MHLLLGNRFVYALIGVYTDRVNDTYLNKITEVLIIKLNLNRLIERDGFTGFLK